MFALGDFGYYWTVNRRETDGFRDNSDLTHKDVSLKWVFDKGGILDLSLYGDYIDREYGRPGVKPPEGTQDYYRGDVKFYNSEAASLLDEGSDEDAHVILQVKSKPAEWLALRLRGDYTYMENYSYTRFNFSGEGNESWVTNEVLGAEGNVDIYPFKGANLLFGVEYKNYDWENASLELDVTGAEDPGTRSTTKADLHTTGTFAEAQYRPCRFFKILAGIRHENHSEFGTENFPLYGLIFNPWEDTALKLSHGKHFRAPTPNDLFWPEDPFSKGNPNLKPETGWHTDATIEQAFIDNRLFITLSYFHWDINDKIQWAPDSSWIWTPQNLDSYKGDGWEVGTKIGPFHNLSLTFNYTYTDAEEENQFVTRRAGYTPKHQFKGNMTYWCDFGLTATATVRYMGDRDDYGNDKTITSPTNTLNSYWTTDLKIKQRLYDHWLLALQGNNLFNKGYDTYLETFTDQNTGTTTIQGYPGSERSFFASIIYEY
jgi:iron complex outermembrane receptor protein